MNKIIILSNNNILFEKLTKSDVLSDFKFILISSKRDLLNFLIANEPLIILVECHDTIQECLKIAKKLSSKPVIAYSKSRNEKIAVQAFLNGADSFFHVPIGSKEFYYRMINFLKLITKNNQYNDQNVINVGQLKIYLQNRQVMHDGKLAMLTNTEYKLLLILVKNIGLLVSNDELYQCMYDTEELKNTSRALSMHISRLRKKLNLNVPNSKLKLITVHGKGFCLKLNGNGINKNNHTS